MDGELGAHVGGVVREGLAAGDGADVDDRAGTEGVLQYDLLRDRAASNRFNLVQRYASMEAVRDHMAAPHSQSGLARIAEWLVKPYVQTDYAPTFE
ncbi:putative quinol monooxygenase [Streptosporangium sp. NPDC000396]|uniref:putative quinol monooxygenase n=1 Tax=Streptosporangium sp. NPDC000396 TaxID=3366185 RepID=UPI0036B8223F